MSAVIIDGKARAQELQTALGLEVESLVRRLGRRPGLAVVLVGDNPASKVYVKSKTKSALACGMDVIDVTLPADVSNEVLQSRLRDLSEQSEIDGILLQLPLPKHLDEFAAICCINPSRDVDGLHPLNQGLLVRDAETLKPCTPLGSLDLVEVACRALKRSTDLAGLHAVVVGRSILVGKPVAQLLLSRNCTVTMCHSRSRELSSIIRSADILIAAVGRPEMIKGADIRPGAIVIDVGINRLSDGRLVGDVEFSSAMKVAGAITPVPGGVGPMTITMLLRNTVESASRSLEGKGTRC